MRIAPEPAKRGSDFAADVSAWQPVTLGQARLTLSSASAGRVPALRMDFDFKDGKGFVVARRVTQRAMPEEYAVRFRLRGRGEVNDLEIKLVDASGNNVWRHVIPNLRLPARWKNIEIDSRHMEFAWGPAGGGLITEISAIEIAIVAREGGAGTLWLSDFRIEDSGPAAVPTASASSALPGCAAGDALGSTGWTPRPDDAKPWIALDFIEPRILGGLIIDWRNGAPGNGFRVRGSLQGQRWRTLHATSRAGGTRSYVYLPDTKTRFLRLELSEPTAGAALRPQSFEFSRSIETFWYNIARSEPRGWHPRWLHREQSLWTPVGTSNGTHCALMNEEGMIEMAPGSFSIEPMLWIEDRLFTWADVTLHQELAQGFLPLPSSTWETADWRLRVQAEATPSGLIRARYRLENLSERSWSARLLLLVRPFQVTPPWQSVGKLGGVSPIHELAWSAGTLRINDTALIVPATEPSGFAGTTFDEGFIVPHLMASSRAVDTPTHDASGLASGALSFDLALQPRASDERVVECMPDATARSCDEPAFDWEGRLPATQWTGVSWAADAIRAALTATAHILVTRS
ncbi:MAG TPA: discoidin domain-containing protein, partial [Burkholderiales bacterium]|nr:discoidin domain-containing protein [Burkholderiales bacterium]